MQEKWADEEAAEVERLARARSAKRNKDENSKNKTSQNIHAWTQKSRYMKDAVNHAPRSLKSTAVREVCSPDLWRPMTLLQALIARHQWLGAIKPPRGDHGAP